jgi:hypothetical protein
VNQPLQKIRSDPQRPQAGVVNQPLQKIRSDPQRPQAGAVNQPLQKTRSDPRRPQAGAHGWNARSRATAICKLNTPIEDDCILPGDQE